MQVVADGRFGRARQVWAYRGIVSGRLRSALQRSFWAFADQGAVSLGSFLTTLLAARSLTPPAYGQYALMFGILLVCITFNGSLVTSSLSVEGSTADVKALRRLAACSVVLTLGVAAVCSIGVLCAALALGGAQLALWPLAALFCWQIQETMRRGLMAHLQYRRALWGDTVSYFGQVIAVWLLAQRGELSFGSLFASMAATSGLAGLLQAAQLGLAVPTLCELRTATGRSWRLGRWLLLGNLTALPTMQGMPWALALLYGPSTTASLQAVINVMGVSHPVMFAVGNLVLPTVARRHRQGGLKVAARTGIMYAWLGAALLVPYYFLVWLRPQQVLGVFYGADSPYSAAADVLRIYVLAYCLTYLAAFLAALLTAVDKSRVVFVAQAASALAGLTIGLPLVALAGLIGAAWGSIATALAFSGTCFVLLRRVRSL